ncbi:response regulator [Streptomyces sp. NPDC005474]|uniref:response regulator n=1 Tax=Streptomyces sp. NPDC005474 TaxID=3154878 RepID=UPI003454FB09
MNTSPPAHGPSQDPGGARPRVLVVDDDQGIRTVVRWQLSDAGYEVTEAADGQSAMTKIAEESPVLVVLDLSLPGVGGLDVLRSVREGRVGGALRDLPVIILSGRDGETDRIIGLDLGADDYLVKPFSPGELAARVRSVLRRAGPRPAEVISVGPLRIEPTTHEAWVGDTRVDLTPKEFELIAFLAAHPRHVFTRRQLLEHVWKSAEWLGEATVTEHIHRVRSKMESAQGPRLIRTVRGVGYQLDIRT